MPVASATGPSNVDRQARRAKTLVLQPMNVCAGSIPFVLLARCIQGHLFGQRPFFHRSLGQRPRNNCPRPIILAEGLVHPAKSTVLWGGARGRWPNGGRSVIEVLGRCPRLRCKRPLAKQVKNNNTSAGYCNFAPQPQRFSSPRQAQRATYKYSYSRKHCVYCLTWCFT